MKDLSKAFENDRAQLITDLHAARKAVREELKVVEAGIVDLNRAIASYNAVLERVHAFRSLVAESIEADWSEKEDDWYGSPESESQEAWKELWEPGYADALDEVSDVTVDPMPHAEELGELPSSPE